MASSLTKGTRVIAQGRLKVRKYQDREGNNRESWELDVDEVGPSLLRATAAVTRASGGGQGGQGGGSGQRAQVDEPWGTPASSGGDTWNAPGTFTEDTPF